ncbi:prolyl 4-hydroxylase subunit alpha-2 [Drosophila subpulchrella]|uniref:prolyl 4-hydroxylase subunit alpha-2 n=1 Tax=Drosophila subpulchrella TaxID=1486046 RepID=UPI0018A148C0|nr:prolyl 4-hydroxylase subunit alpha-2 [Drosophila subpulchrella]
MRIVVRFFTVLVAIIFPNWVCTTKMENYFDLDWQLMTELKSYSEELQGHISVLNRYIDDRKSELAKVGNDREKYLGNPINSYSLLHHLHFDWPIWRKLMVRPLATEQVGEIRELLSKIPTKGEYMDSIKEAIDFQKQEDDYVNSNEGIIGQESEVLEEGALFSPMESLEIAQYAYDQENYEQAEDWLNTTLNGYKNLDHEEREVYKVIIPVSESQVQDLYEKVKKINRRLLGLVFAYISLSKSETCPALTILKLINFLQINVHLVEHLDKYIEALDTKLRVINEALVDLATYHIQFENDKLGIISSPVGSYSLIHHMQSDWTHWQFFVQEDPGKDEIKYLISKTKYLPVEEDITEVCQAIFSIINAYDLLPRDIARGFILGNRYKYSLSPLDCLRMADHSTAIRDFEKSSQWLQVAISILENPNYTKPLSAFPHLNTADLYLKLAEVYVRQRNWHTALETVEIALESNPRNANLLRMQEHLSFQILLDPPSSMDFNNGNNKQGFQGSKSLYCFYHARNGSVNLFLAPNKAEIIFIDPLSVIYHD